MRLFLFSLICLAIPSSGQEAGSPALRSPASRKYAASAATARGIRPNQEGKFQSVEVLWPVDVPADLCYWRGAIQPEGGPVAAITGSQMIAQGKATLSLIFDGSVVATSGKAAWTFQGLIGCDSTGREPGISTETKLTLQPSAYAKRPGLAVLSPVQIRTSPGSEGIEALYVRTDAADPAVFEFVNLPAGFQPRIEPSSAPNGQSAMVTIFVDHTVRAGRYYMPVRVTVGANQGTADVVVDVAAEP